MMKYTLNVIIICIALNANGTMVLPYDNLGQLVKISDDVVIVEVKNDLFTLSEDLSNYAWELEIKKSFKGQFQSNELFTISSFSGRSDHSIHHILGDINLKVGKTYLLFLDHTDNDTWKPICLSFYNYQLETLAGKNHWVPTKEAMGMCMWRESNPLFALKKIEMENEISQYISTDYTIEWRDNKVKSDASVFDFHPSLRTPPSSCAFLFDGSSCLNTNYDGVRWQAFPSNPVEIWLDTEQQNGIGSEQICDDAIDEMSTNYAGLNIPFEGIVGSNFTPNCTNNSAVMGNFTSYSNGVNSGDNILTIFNDPCSQITDLNNCAGVLAIGGLYAFCLNSGNDNYDNLNWLQATNGYVVVNNGSECLSDADFEIMMTHEYTHALGLDHIASSNGTANMNPSCCNSITTLDIDCVDYLYPASTTVPVSWLDFTVTEEFDYNLLEWSTASEVNNDHFIIEFSKADYGLKIWKELGTLDSYGNSSEISKYQFQDNQNLGAQTYYRIKQVDQNGKSTYSETISIERKLEKNEISIFPNPASDLLNLVGNIEGASIILVDGLGRQVNHNILSTNEYLTKIDVSSLQNGVYYIKIENNIDNSVHTFIKN